MTLPLDPGPLPFRIDELGYARVGESNMTLDVFISVYEQEKSAEHIIENYPWLTPADVFGALAYYFRNRDAVDAYIAPHKRAADELREQCEKDPRNIALREKFRKLKAERDAAAARG